VRLCLEALREAQGPLRARSVAEYAMMAKGLPVDDAEVRTVLIEHVRMALIRLERRGMVRKVVVAPEVWWELVGADKAAAASRAAGGLDDCHSAEIHSYRERHQGTPT
jgi:hypothetical protein